MYQYQRIPEHYRPNPYGPPNQPSPIQHYSPYDQQLKMDNSHYLNEPAPPPPVTPFEQYAKPAQPQNWPPFMQQNPNFHPNQQLPQQPNNSFITYFQDQNGQMDFGKMLSTVNQVASTWQQVSPVFKQIQSIIQGFR